MSINERQRQALFTSLDSTLGNEAAEVMMELLPRQPHTELATKTDLAATSARLEGAMTELRSEVGGEMAELRGEMSELRSELKGEMAELRGEMAEFRGEMAEFRGEMAELRGEGREMKGELKNDIARLYQWGAGVVAANGVAVMAALFT